MSADKYPSVFSRQMETIVYLVVRLSAKIDIELFVYKNFDQAT